MLDNLYKHKYKLRPIIIIFPLRSYLQKWVYHHKRLKDFFQGWKKKHVKLHKALKSFQIRPTKSSKYIELLLSSLDLLYRLLFVVCSFVALFTSGYFYCVCILYVFLKIKQLHPILIAVKKSCKCT